MKVVQLVEGHNFHVDWHFKFWVEKDENLAQRSVPPVHCNRVAFKVGKSFVQNLLSKTPYSLCGSCRWDWDLQLSYSTFGAPLYKILDIINFKLVAGITIWARAPPRHDVELPSPRSRAAPINAARSPLLPPALPLHRAICAAAVELRPSLPSTVEQPPMPLP
jgi:hypothetical protein